MPNYLALFHSSMLSEVHNRYIASDLITLNEHTAMRGIVLSERDCTEIAQCRGNLLVESERIEVGSGAVRRIIEEFCESGYVNQQNFKSVVQDLLECFYTIKTETEDKVDDETVLEFLKYIFENDAGGDVSKIYFCDAFEHFINTGRSDGFIKRPENDYLN